MTIEDYVLTYRNEEGKVVANPEDYYDMIIGPQEPKYGRHSMTDGGQVVCPFHDDINPSMGTMKDRNKPGVKLFHCFGCGKTGNVIKMHQLTLSRFMHKEMSSEDAAYELASIFQIPVADFDTVAEEDYEKRYMRNMRRIQELERNSYTKTDFSDDIIAIKLDAQKNGEIPNLDVVGSPCVKMIATVKQLYNY